MPEYFIISESIDTRVIGPSYPQCIGLLKTYNNNYENQASLYFFAHHKGVKIDFYPDLDSIKIAKKAKLTDIISCSLGPGNDQIVSLKFKQIITKYKTSELQFFSCVLHQSEERHKYCWIHFVYNLECHVDFERSVFSHVNEDLQKKARSMRNYDDFLKFYEIYDKYGLIKADKIVVNHSPLDFFVIGRFNQKHYVSKRLKEKLEEQNIIGVNFQIATDVGFI